jgi:hypothetical protein
MDRKENVQLSQKLVTLAYDTGNYELVETLTEFGAHDIGAHDIGAHDNGAIEKGELLERYLAANADQFAFL